MTDTRRWDVAVLIGETDGRTYAEAQLESDLRTTVMGTGQARLHPDELNVPEIGDELAAARALNDLGHRLLSLAAGDLSSVTHEHVELRS